MRKPTIGILLTLFFVLKLAAQPTVEWDKTFGGSSWEQLNTAVKTEDGAFLLCGSSSSGRSGDVSEAGYGDADYYVVRIDSFGNKLWDRRYGGDGPDICLKALQNPEGFLLIGRTNSGINGNKTAEGMGDRDVWIIQIRPDGSKVWDKCYGGNGLDEPFSAVRLDNGDYIISCHSDSPAGSGKTDDNIGGRDIWMLRIDRTGNKIWDKTYGGTGNDEFPTALTQTKDGNFVVACGSTSNASGNKSEPSRGGKDFWVFKIDGNGNLIWEKTIGGDYEDAPFDIQQLNDGSLIIGGNTKSGISGDKKAPRQGMDIPEAEARDYDYWVLKLSIDGKKVIWDKTFGGTNWDILTCIDQNKTGYFLVAGQSISKPSGNKLDSLKGSYDFWVLYLKEDGTKVWEKNIGGNNSDVAKEMVKFRDGSYLICGESKSDTGFDKSEDNRDKNPNPLEKTDDMWAVKITCLFDLDIGNDTIVCKLRPVVLDASIPNCRNCLYEWSTGETSPQITFNPTKTSSIFVNITANNACELTDKIQIVVYPSPDEVSYIVKDPKCHNGNDGVIALDSARGGTPPYFLIMNQDTILRRAFIDKLKPGNYPISLVDRKGCRLDTTLTVSNPSPFILTVTPDQDLQLGDSFRLFAYTSKPIDSFFWNDKSIRTLDTILKPFDSQNFTFTAIDKHGCLRDTTTQIVVKRNNLYFAPTAFNPLSSEVENTRYKIYGGKTVKSIRNFQIFNRWGEMMYATAQIFPTTSSDIGWNGTINGQEALPAVYVYFAEVTYIDGRREIIKGDFTLFR